MKSLWTIIRHNQAFAIGTCMALLVVLWVYGCQSTAVSMLNPPSRVTRAELQAEVDSLLVQAKLKFEIMDREDKIKTTLFNTAITYAQGGSINPFAVAVVIGNILGLGAVIDNRRKDVLIKTLKSGE